MTSESSSNEVISKLMSFVDRLPRLIGAVSVASLAMSVVYNWGYFLAIDRSLIETLSIEDYVSSGIAYLPLAIAVYVAATLVGILLGVNLTKWADRSSQQVSGKGDAPGAINQRDSRWHRHKGKLVSGFLLVLSLTIVYNAANAFYGGNSVSVMPLIILVMAFSICVVLLLIGYRVIPTRADFHVAYIGMLFAFALLHSFSTGYSNAVRDLGAPPDSRLVLKLDGGTSEIAHAKLLRITSQYIVYRTTTVTVAHASEVSRIVLEVPKFDQSIYCKLNSPC